MGFVFFLFHPTTGLYECPYIGCVLTVATSVTFTIGVCLLPDSPRYLCYKERVEDARDVLNKFKDIDHQTESALVEWEKENVERTQGFVGFMQQPDLPTRKLLVVVGLVVAQQLLGVTALIFAMEQIFSLTCKYIY